MFKVFILSLKLLVKARIIRFSNLLPNLKSEPVPKIFQVISTHWLFSSRDFRLYLKLETLLSIMRDYKLSCVTSERPSYNLLLTVTLIVVFTASRSSSKVHE